MSASAQPQNSSAGTRHPLRLAVVGHTNTGKTSLLRTLARDPAFGQVSDSPGTTRDVRGVQLLLQGRPAIELFDTPGLEDGMGLLDYLDQIAAPALRLDGPERIQRLLDAPGSHDLFEQEARVLRKLLECDAALYVVDVRDPVLGKHKDELAALALCGRPLLPVLNFIHDPRQRAAAWRDALARLGLHAAVEFDTVAPALDGEARLYGKLGLMLDAHAALLAEVQQDIAQERERRHTDALRLVAELLVDAAALRLSCPPDDASLRQATESLRERIRRREQGCVHDLLARYNFRPEDYPRHTLPLQGERWDMDLFHPEALRSMGLHVGKGMAAGAMAGVTVDLLTAGLSLGAAALVGAAAGGLWQSVERLGKRLTGRIQGYRELTVDDQVLRLLGLRQLALIRALQLRGHAAQAPISLEPDSVSAGMPALPQNHADAHAHASAEPARGAGVLRQRHLPDELAQARAHPEWSALTNDQLSDTRRERAVLRLVEQLKTDS